VGRVEQSPRRSEAGRNLVSICPFFIVKDLQASIAHYIERFGFQLDFQGPEGSVFYGQVSRDGIADGYVLAFFRDRKAP
jgi:hypothetical protein